MTQDKPRPYDISNPLERRRLFKELYSYMKISINDGTDFEGRRYALEALREIVEAENILYGRPEPYLFVINRKNTCKATTRDGTSCLNKALKEGLCMIHFKKLSNKKR